MIIYRASKTDFINDVEYGIEDILLANFREKLHRSVGPSEVASWRNSLLPMAMVLKDAGIPDDVGVGIEYSIPSTNKRIDVLVTGSGPDGVATAVVVELKQWETVQSTRLDAVVKTLINKSIRETTHPSYQAWSYAQLLRDFNENVERVPVHLAPCAFLHNCKDGTDLLSDFYSPYTRQAPVFLRPDAARLREFIRKHVVRGDGGNTLYVIENGKIVPSKSLADALGRTLKGNPEFTMLDEQKIAYETILRSCDIPDTQTKSVIIVDGAPGTGKSVVAVNVLAALTRRKKLAKYVSKNAAPREVYQQRLSGEVTKSRFRELFVGSGTFYKSGRDTFDVLLADEAHRLNAKSGLYETEGENQVKEIILASRVAVFFVDERQRVALKDIGTKDEIRRWAAQAGATVKEVELTSQFRCNGQDAWPAWVDHTLQIRETANPNLEGVDYDFRVCSDPTELHALITERNRSNNRSRLVAGYCWPWRSKKNIDSWDIEIPAGSYKARWNLASDGSGWLARPNSVSEVGCIHTCQGLEVDYIGVIIGPDLVVRNGVVECRPQDRDKNDKTIRGWKKLRSRDPANTDALLANIIKNTYRTLMTRGMKGCYVFATDPETNDWIRRCAL